MRLRTMTITHGVADSLSNAHTPAPSKKFYTFEGDLYHMCEAANVAMRLGMEVGYASGIPYVQSKEDYDKVVNYIIENQVEGYWNYIKG